MDQPSPPATSTAQTIRDELERERALIVQSVTDKLRADIERDRNFVKETIGLAFKVLAGVILVAGLLGYKDWAGLVAKVQESLYQDAKARIQADAQSPESKYWHSLDELMQVTVLHANVAKLARADLPVLGSDPASAETGEEDDDGHVTVEAGDARVLLRLIQRSNATAAQFSEALAVIARCEDPEVIREYTRLVADLFVASNPELRWIKDQTDKRRAVFAEIRLTPDKWTVSLPLIQAEVRQFLVLRQASGEEAISTDQAIRFARDTADTEALPALRRLTASLLYKDDAILAIARILPWDDSITQWIAGNRPSNPAAFSPANAEAHLAVSLVQFQYYQSNRLNDTPSAEQALAAAKSNVLYLINDIGLRFVGLEKDELLYSLPNRAQPLSVILRDEEGHAGPGAAILTKVRAAGGDYCRPSAVILALLREAVLPLKPADLAKILRAFSDGFEVKWSLTPAALYKASLKLQDGAVLNEKMVRVAALDGAIRLLRDDDTAAPLGLLGEVTGRMPAFRFYPKPKAAAEDAKEEDSP